MPVVNRISDRAWGWIGPVAVAVLAGVLRIRDLGNPNELMFDETYYAKDAWSLLNFGYVQDFVETANEQILAGDVGEIFTGEPSWIVHPDGGKWAIALGEYFFGLTPFGWRIAAAVAGALTVLVLARLILRLTGSAVVACIGGLLLTLDGTHFVMSRMALLDIFLTFWLVAAVSCVAADRDWLLRRLSEHQRWEPLRPWQLLAGVCFGAAAATKWSGLYVLAAFGVAIVAWELWTRWWILTPAERRLSWLGRALVTVGAPAFGSLVMVALIVYLVSWTGWLINHEVYDARFGNGYGDIEVWPHLADPAREPQFLDPLRSLWQFHVMTYDFHTGDYLAGVDHPYKSHPAGWLIQWRPVSISVNSGVDPAACGAPADSTCIQEVLVLGNPVVWWSGAVALAAAVVVWIRNPSWRWGIGLLGVATTWLPWFVSSGRPLFAFYAVATIPFTVIAICLAIHGVAQRLGPGTDRHRWWWVAISVYLAAVVAAFVYFLPLWTNVLLPYPDWLSRMWFSRWI